MWQRLASEWRLEQLDTIAQEIGLADVPGVFLKFASCEISGRVVVRID